MKCVKSAYSNSSVYIFYFGSYNNFVSCIRSIQDVALFIVSFMTCRSILAVARYDLMFDIHTIHRRNCFSKS